VSDLKRVGLQKNQDADTEEQHDEFIFPDHSDSPLRHQVPVSARTQVLE
jgi:hypothetical protein